MADVPGRVPGASQAIDFEDIAAVTEVLRSGVPANGPQAAARQFYAYTWAELASRAILSTSGPVAAR